MEALYTQTEGIVYQWLSKNNIPFDFQSTLSGGRSELGGITAPFVLQDRPVVIRTFDSVDGVVKEAKDRQEREVLHRVGYIVVDVHDYDLATQLDMVMDRALNGREMSEIDSDLWFPYMGNVVGTPTFAGIISLVPGYGPPDSGSVVAPTCSTAAQSSPTGTTITDTFDASLVGYINNISTTFNETWDDIHDTEQRLELNDTTYEYAGIGLYHYGTPNYWLFISRSVCFFNTSLIALGSSILSGYITLYSNEIPLDYLNISPSYCLSSFISSSDSSISANDFFSFTGTVLSLIIGWESLPDPDGAKNFTLNAAGLTAIDIGGITKIGIQNYNDVIDSEPTIPDHSGGAESDYWVWSDEAIEALRPTLTLTYVSVGDTYDVTLNGSISYDGGGDCSVRFQWGETTAYGHDTPWQTGKLTGATFTQSLSNLVSGTTYHFRAQVRNKYGIANGDDVSFSYGT